MPPRSDCFSKQTISGTSAPARRAASNARSCARPLGPAPRTAIRWVMLSVSPLVWHACKWHADARLQRAAPDGPREEKAEGNPRPEQCSVPADNRAWTYATGGVRRAEGLERSERTLSDGKSA